ncbi:hypothetical protein EMMF5_004756 [Cystobasidiomycetes sp. EMM_F5]
MSSTTNTNTGSNVSSGTERVTGSGLFQPGTTVREIEGHFNKQNDPQGVAPISQTGGVPNVGQWSFFSPHAIYSQILLAPMPPDYLAQKAEAAKDKLTGHKTN